MGILLHQDHKMQTTAAGWGEDGGRDGEEWG